ncbi:unnamed protein product [Rhizoctonia solani]|uniref:Uncharacterized protein n=1 Tax=Rhizoctonia solani TaxID=456999 RepID=A0A8H3I1T9_9AGAM|nr:unnamed protein product [Rhizoctonia solani]
MLAVAVYRDEYPSNIFLGENTYVPPSVPSHIPISLEPVIGSPSDGELESVHDAVRTLEGLAHSPFYDTTFGMRLSQHLFNLQFARYIQDSNQGHFTQRSENTESFRTNENQPPISGSPSAPNISLPFQDNKNEPPVVTRNPPPETVAHQESQGTGSTEPSKRTK